MPTFTQARAIIALVATTLAVTVIRSFRLPAHRHRHLDDELVAAGWRRPGVSVLAADDRSADRSNRAFRSGRLNGAGLAPSFTAGRAATMAHAARMAVCARATTTSSITGSMGTR